jgi:hypothetical protein
MRYFFLILIVLFTILIAKINICLYSENYSYSEKKADILLQLNFLESGLKNENLGEQMQQMFPEGFVFINALYGLTWCEIALSDSENDTKIKEKALHEALFAYNEINSDNAKWPFDPDISPKYGIFYCGWKNYLLSKILSIDSTFEGHEIYEKDFKNQCDSILSALKNSKSPYLQSYSFQSWPADMFVGIASLSNYDKIYSPRYKGEIDAWINEILQRPDPSTLLVPHKVDSKTGKSIQGSRGSSMSLILRMLSEINPKLAEEQYRLFKKNFETKTFGLPSIREYPKGKHGFGDIDSGPVIFGVGFSATIDMIGTYSRLNSENLAEKQYKTINAFGFGHTTKNQKKYLFGKLPMADAFIAWGRASGLKFQVPIKDDSHNWRMKFHILSLTFLLILWIFCFRKSLIHKIKSAFNA